MRTTIDWIEYSEINLRKAFCDEIAAAIADHSIKIIANSLYINPFKPTKSKQITPQCTEIYNEYSYMIGKTQVEIYWSNDKNDVEIWFKNIHKFEYFCPLNLITYE